MGVKQGMKRKGKVAAVREKRERPPRVRGATAAEEENDEALG
jgi:hypothetical protein